MKDKRIFRNLARYLCAAYLANQLGITPATALKSHVSEDPGEFWFHLAEVVSRAMTEKIDEHFSAIGKPETKGITE